jgi:hypothetical protein
MPNCVGPFSAQACPSLPLSLDAASITLDAASITLDAKVDTLGLGENAMLGSNTAPDDPSIHHHACKQHSSDAPIPLDSRLAFHNTVEMLPPATGPPHQLVGVDCCAHECWPAFDPHSRDPHLGDPLGAESRHNYSDHGETLANLLPSDMGEVQPTFKRGDSFAHTEIPPLTVDYGECLPAIKDHSKGLDNDGEITTKIISTITTDDPIIDALLLCGKDSQQPRECIVCFHAHVSQVIGIHAKDLDNDGEITTKLISTITTDDPITKNTPIDCVCSSATSPRAKNYHGIPTTYLHEFGFTNSFHKMAGANFPTNMDPSDPNDTDATLLPTFKHGDSFED